jgi:radical SAM protein with 4Fe4S-binding SPASM domain
MAEFAIKFHGLRGDRLFGCGASGGHSLCIDAYGRAQACLGLRAPELTVPLTPDAVRIGESVENLAAALERFQVLGEKRATNPDYLVRCARCFLKALCEQCPAKAWTETGTLDTPVEYLCEVTHAQARFLGWLGQSEQAWEVVDWQDRINNLPDRTEEDIVSAPTHPNPIEIESQINRGFHD